VVVGFPRVELLEGYKMLTHKQYMLKKEKKSIHRKEVSKRHLRAQWAYNNRMVSAAKVVKK